MKFEIEDDKQQLIYNRHKHQKLKWTTFELCVIVLIGVITASLLSNIDRIIGSVSNNKNKESLKDNYDIIIVGGGTTGLFQLYFLSLNYPDLKIILLEKLNRIGGRSFSGHILYSKNNTHNITVNFDNGAMRCSYNHKYMMQTLYYFDLCDHLVPLSAGNPDDTNSNNNTQSYPFYYFRGHFKLWNNVNISYWNDIYNLQLNNFLQNITNKNQTINMINYLLNYGWNNILIENNAEIEPQTEQEWNIFFSTWTFKDILLKDYDMLTFFRIAMNVSVEFLNHVEDINHIFYYHARNMAWYYYAQFSQTRDFNGMFTLKYGFDTISNVIYNQIINDNENERFQNIEIILNESVIGIDKIN
eukprot:135621_1